MNKKISTLSISTTVTGAFVGAGFASGSELWQFFGAFGKKGIFTMLLSLFMLCILCILFTRYCKKTEQFYLDTSVFGNAPKSVNSIFCSLELLLYFFLSVIMTSAFVALVSSFTSEKVALIFGLIFTAVTGISLYFGLSGLVKLFSAFIPLLVAATVLISAATLFKNGFIIPDATEVSNDNPLLKFPVLSCFLSLSYNFFGSVGILAPLSKNAKSAKQLTVSSIIGILFLALIALSIILAIFSTGTHSEALPMLEIAKLLHPAVGIIYAVVLSSAMFGCSYSSSVCMILFVEKKALHTKLKKILFIILYSSAVYAVSLLGFTDLISTVYPIFGYVGFALIAAVICNSITYRRKRNV